MQTNIQTQEEVRENLEAQVRTFVDGQMRQVGMGYSKAGSAPGFKLDFESRARGDLAMQNILGLITLGFSVMFMMFPLGIMPAVGAVLGLGSVFILIRNNYNIPHRLIVEGKAEGLEIRRIYNFRRNKDEVQYRNLKELDFEHQTTGDYEDLQGMVFMNMRIRWVKLILKLDNKQITIGRRFAWEDMAVLREYIREDWQAWKKGGETGHE